MQGSNPSQSTRPARKTPGERHPPPSPAGRRKFPASASPLSRFLPRLPGARSTTSSLYSLYTAALLQPPPTPPAAASGRPRDHWLERAELPLGRAHVSELSLHRKVARKEKGEVQAAHLQQVGRSRRGKRLCERQRRGRKRGRRARKKMFKYIALFLCLTSASAFQRALPGAQRRTARRSTMKMANPIAVCDVSSRARHAPRPRGPSTAARGGNPLTPAPIRPSERPPPCRSPPADVDGPVQGGALP